MPRKKDSGCKPKKKTEEVQEKPAGEVAVEQPT
jgi:hypothetical protein